MSSFDALNSSFAEGEDPFGGDPAPFSGFSSSVDPPDQSFTDATFIEETSLDSLNLNSDPLEEVSSSSSSSSTPMPAVGQELTNITPKKMEVNIENVDYFTIVIEKPIINGEGVGAYVLYQINTKTTLDIYSSNEMTTERRFSDFVWLQQQLIESNKGIIIPPLPEKEGFATNKYTSSYRFDSSLLEFRRKELEKFLCRVSSHPTLCTSKHLQLFLETKDSVTQIAKKSEEPATSSGGFFSSIFTSGMKTVGLVGVTPVEVDPWFTEKATYFDLLETRLNQLNKAGQELINKHQEMGAVQLTWAESTKNASECEAAVNNTLSRDFKSLSEISTQTQMLQQELVDSANLQFQDTVKDAARWISSVRKVLAYRLEKLGEYQGAKKSLETKKQKVGSNTDEKAASQITEAQHKVEEAREVYESVTELVKNELTRFEATKSSDIHEAIAQLVQLNINLEIRVLDLWKRFLNEM